MVTITAAAGATHISNGENMFGTRVYLGSFSHELKQKAESIGNEVIGEAVKRGVVMTHVLQWVLGHRSGRQDLFACVAASTTHPSTLKRSILERFADRSMKELHPVRASRAEARTREGSVEGTDAHRGQPKSKKPPSKAAVSSHKKPIIVRKTPYRSICIGCEWKEVHKAVVQAAATKPMIAHPEVAAGRVRYTTHWKRGERGLRFRFNVYGQWASEQQWADFMVPVRAKMSDAVKKATGVLVRASQPWSTNRLLGIIPPKKPKVQKTTVQTKSPAESGLAVKCCVNGCNTISANAKDAASHMNTNHAVLLQQTDSKGRQIFCSYCGYVTLRHNALKDHMVKHTRDQHFAGHSCK